MSDVDLDSGSAPAGSKSRSTQASALRKNNYVLLKGSPCKITELSTSKTGKHGHDKVYITAVDVFTGKTYEDVSPSTHIVEVPVVTRIEYMLTNVADGFLSLMDESGETKGDIVLPEGQLGKDIQKAFEDGKDVLIVVIAAMDREAAVAHRTTE
ncbi:translation initiation factor IF-5A [Streptomyces sp. NPDC001502]|uniref:translation initiation factor IF-5A n=1 Tax=Streptomyces sp. NPDC001502 TaxID=3364578 RepID=UPI00369FF905